MPAGGRPDERREPIALSRRVLVAQHCGQRLDPAQQRLHDGPRVARDGVSHGSDMGGVLLDALAAVTWCAASAHLGKNARGDRTPWMQPPAALAERDRLVHRGDGELG